MSISKGRFIVIVVASFAFGIILTLAILLAFFSLGSGGGDGIDSSKLRQIDSYIDKYYLKDYDKKEMVDNAYRGYVAGLGDPYSAYMTKEEYDNYQTSTTGSYSGIGVTFETSEKGQYVVVAVTKGSPADKKGIKTGDIILEVDGKSYSTSDLMATHIRGKKGTKVKLTILHGKDEKTVTMVREKIEQDSVEYEMLDAATGYIKITSFIESTGKDFTKALQSIESDGADSLILDLRDNGGGLVDDAVAVADLFLDEGVACYVSDKNGQTEEYTVKDGKTDLDTVILVNGNSASASEILTAAMQDNGYKVVGEKTFGKGIIQTSFEMPGGDALKLTILEYLSPKKNKVHEKGVKPDYKVKDNKKTKQDEQLEKAKDLIQH